MPTTVTASGLTKFAPDNANTISNNVIRNIVEEAKGILWVATDYGINRIDVENDRIERFYPGYEDNGPTAEQVFSVAAAADGTIFCAATGWGIACYDKALGRLSALNVPQFNSSEIRAVYYGGQNTLLLHTVQEELVRIRYGLSAAGEHGGAGKGRALPRRRGQVGVRQPDGALPGYGRCGNLPLRTPRRGAGGGGQISPRPRPVRYALSPNTATITC